MHFCSSTFYFPSQIVSSGKLILPLSGLSKGKSKLTVVADYLSAGRDEVLLHFRGQKLDRKSWFGLYVSGATAYVVSTKRIQLTHSGVLTSSHLSIRVFHL
jgi:hypothetical protein